MWLKSITKLSFIYQSLAKTKIASKNHSGIKSHMDFNKKKVNKFKHCNNTYLEEKNKTSKWLELAHTNN